MHEIGMTSGTRPNRLATAVLGVLVGLAALLAFTSTASAQQGGVGFSAIPRFPEQATVGAQDVAVSLRLVNSSDGEYLDDNFRVDEITLVPSCGSKLQSGDCPEGSRDPGVFTLSPTASGRNGTACANVAFTVSEIDASQGKFLFAPSTSFVLGTPGTSAGECVIDFSVDVARVPAIDSDAPEAGVQTDQKGALRSVSVTPGGELGQQGSGTGTDETTVTPPPPPPPPENPPPPPPTPSPPPPPGPATPAPPGPSAVLPASEAVRGTASIRGPTSCAGTPFRVTVRGGQISRVVFSVDGKVKRTLTKPNSGTLYTLTINPRTYGAGVHRVVARVTFRTRSATAPKTLRTVFSPCARRAARPNFTG